MKSRTLLLFAVITVNVMITVSCAPKSSGLTAGKIRPVDRVTMDEKPCFIAEYPRPVMESNGRLVMDRYVMTVVRYPKGSRAFKGFKPPSTRYRQGLVLDQPVLSAPGVPRWSVVALEPSPSSPDTIYLTGRIAIQGKKGIVEVVFRTIAPDIHRLESTGIATWNRSEIGNVEIIDMGYILETVAGTIRFTGCR